MAASADTLKAVTLELGGKSPLLVFEDADLDHAVSAALLANFYTQGEVCSNGTRVFVHRDVHDRFVDALRTRTEKLTIGDPLDPATDVGALISEAHMQKVLGYIDAGVAAGARVVCGGRRATGTDVLDRGWFVEPTIFTGCTDDMTHRPRGDLRSGDERAPVRHRGRGRRPRQRHRVRPRGRAVHARPGARPPGRGRARGRDRVGQHLQPHADRGAVRRGRSSRASGGRTASPRSSTTPSARPSTSRPAASTRRTSRVVRGRGQRTTTVRSPLSSTRRSACQRTARARTWASTS